jgi:hypothetical protein
VAVADDAVFMRVGGDLDAVAQVEYREKAGDEAFDGGFAEVELRGDLGSLRTSRTSLSSRSVECPERVTGQAAEEGDSRAAAPVRHSAPTSPSSTSSSASRNSPLRWPRAQQLREEFDAQQLRENSMLHVALRDLGSASSVVDSSGSL